MLQLRARRLVVNALARERLRGVLVGVARRYGITVHFESEVTEVRSGTREAVVTDKKNDTTSTLPYDVMHLVPPQSAPDWIKKGPLADPNNASPVRWHEDDVDCALRHVAHSLLREPGSIPLQDGGDDPAPTARALEYLRKRIGVPRDMDYEAARQFRAHLTHAIDELVA